MTNPQALICLHFPDLKINKITKIGEGTGNTAYEVNSHFVFRFPKNPDSQLRLKQEISLQKYLKNIQLCLFLNLFISLQIILLLVIKKFPVLL